jgi:hypothetical protein
LDVLSRAVEITKAVASIIGAVAGIAFFGAIFIEVAKSSIKSRREENQLRERLKTQGDAIESTQATTAGLLDSAVPILENASDQQRLLLVKSEARLQRLYSLGTVLLVLSVLVPFVLVTIYLSTNTLDALAQLIKAGVDPKTASEVARRDWHLLVAGVSFGLLFLASARAIVAAEARHRETYFALSRRVNYYADMSSALRLADRLDSDSKADGATRQQAVRLLINQLLVGVKNQGADGVLTPPDNDNSIPEVVKALAALTGKEPK